VQKKSTYEKKETLEALHFHLSSSLANMSKRQQQQQSRRQKKTTATVGLVEKNTNPCVVFVLLCCSLSILRMIFLLFASHLKVSFSRHTTVFFLSIHFFSLTRDSFFFFFFFFRVLDVPFALVSKKQGREKDSGVLYASSSFRERRFCWRRR